MFPFFVHFLFPIYNKSFLAYIAIYIGNLILKYYHCQDIELSFNSTSIVQAIYVTFGNDIAIIND